MSQACSRPPGERPFADLAGLPAEERSALGAEVARHESIEDAVRWGLASRPRRWPAEVLVQDELTHQVLFPYREVDDLWLVYDTT